MSNYLPGRVVAEREDLVMLQCESGHEFRVTFLHAFPVPAEGFLVVKHCPFCGCMKLKEI